MAQRSYRDEYYPSEDLEVCQENIDDFFNFMNERQNIWYRRFIEKLPRDKWTNDHILATTKYTNVYRQLDRGTLWYIDKIARQFRKKMKKAKGDKKKELLKNLVWKTAMYRLCNRIETFEEVGLPGINKFDPKTFRDGLKAIYDRGESVMTSAHLTCPTPKGLKKYEGYILACFHMFNNIDRVIEEIENASEAEDVFYAVKSIHCIGGFTAYEIYCDLCYCKAIKFDTNDFVNVGPGAKEGVRLLYPSTKGIDNIEGRLRQLHEEQHDHFKRLGIDFKYYNKFEPVKNELSLRSIEHSLCEYSKYWLQNRGLGKKRMIFDPDKYCSLVNDEGDGITFESNEDRIKRNKEFDKDRNEVIDFLKTKGLSKDEMKEFIRMLREKEE